MRISTARACGRIRWPASRRSAEPDGHQRGAHGGQELEDQPGEQGDTQGRQRGRTHFLARGGHRPLVVPGPAERPQQRQALDQRVEAVAEALEAGQPTADRGRGVRPDQPGQHRADHQRQPARPAETRSRWPIQASSSAGTATASTARQAGPGTRTGRDRRPRSRSGSSCRPVLSTSPPLIGAETGATRPGR